MGQAPPPPLPASRGFSEEPPIPTPPRKRSSRWLVIAVLCGIVGSCVALAAGGNHGTQNLKLTADDRAIHPSKVGEQGGETLAITNNDTFIQDLVIFYADGHDNWVDHHVVDAGGCQLDKGINAFRCGPLNAGQSVTITIVGAARDAGNFTYGWGLGDDPPNGGDLRQWGQMFTWSEAVSP